MAARGYPDTPKKGGAISGIDQKGVKVFQAGTADVHTVVINGRVVKYEGRRIGLPLAPIADKVAASVDYGTKILQPLCQSMKPVRCHWIDSDATLHMTLRDTTHPTDEGFNALARTIFEFMEKEGIRR